MRPTAQLHEIMKMKFLDVYGRFDNEELSVEEAIALLGVSRSTFYRMRQRYQKFGDEGLMDHRVGKVSPKRIPVDVQMAIGELYRSKYSGWVVKHFHEKLPEHGFVLSYTSAKNLLQSQGLVPRAPKRGKHRRKRVPKPMRGMLLHQDASSHEWVDGKMWDLVVTMDDATNEIYSMFFCDQEGTASTFRGLYETMSVHGLPCSLYTDCGSHYFYTPKAGEGVAKDRLTQVGRALKQLGIEHIAAGSPQARGRSERVFRTLQGRLPNELKLYGIKDMASANKFLQEKYMPAHNKRFAHAPESEESAFCPLSGVNLKDILCIQEERVVSNDNTVSYKNVRLQLDKDKYRLHYVRCKVCIHEYPNGELAVFHGPRKLAAHIVKSKAEAEKVLQDGFTASEPELIKKEMAGNFAPSPAINSSCQSAPGSLPTVALSSDWQNPYRNSSL